MRVFRGISVNRHNFLHAGLLIKRLLLAFGIYWLARLAFLIFNWKLFSAYPATQLLSTFIYGSLFDVSAIIYFNSLFILLHLLPLPWRNKKFYQYTLLWLFVLVNGFTLVLNLIDTGYFSFSGKRSGMDLFTGENEIGRFWIQYVFDFWYLFILLLAVLFAIYVLYPKQKSSSAPIKTSNTKHYILQIVILIIALPLLLLGVRGGWQLRPIRPFDAARFVDPGLVPVTLNTPFQILMTVQGNRLPVPEYMSQNQAEALTNVIKQYQPLFQPSTKPNIVIIILESFGKEYIGYFNNGKGYTPFLDSLCGQSLVCADAYANGKRSSDAIPAIMSGLPSLMDVPYINSIYSDNKVRTLGSYLREMSYTSSFYHGARNGSMGFDNFLLLGGNGEYFGLSQYPDEKDFDGSWGIYDEPYLQYFASEINKKTQPFCTGVFTLSSHHPYPIPPQLKSKFPEGSLPIHKSIRYADYSLAKFFETAKKQPWYNNTIFVLTADHSAENETPLYQSMYGKFAIPILFFAPGKQLIGKIEKPVAQVDITPSILHFTGYTKPIFSFGSSVFTPEKAKTTGVIQNDGGIYQYITDSLVLHFNGSEVVAVFDKKNDPLLKENLLDKLPQQPALEQQLKAILQVFYSRINQNNLTAGN